VLAHLDELGPAFEIGLQPAQWYFRHSELEPQAIEEESVVNGVESRFEKVGWQMLRKAFCELIVSNTCKM